MRTFLNKAVSTFIGCMMLSAAAVGAEYPTKPITVLIPFPPGGNVDLATRMVSKHMSDTLGQTIVVQNRAGAGGLIAYEAAARAQPDGYVISSLASSSFLVTPRMARKPDMTLAAYTPIGAISDAPMVLVVPAASQYRTASDFLAAVKANPEKVSIGHSGNGTTSHVAILTLENLASLRFNVIAYRGGSPALTDLMGSQLDGMIDQLSSSLQHIESGRIKALAVLSAKRLQELPDVPTLQEVGINYSVSATTGLVGPASMPANIVATLNAALVKALALPEVQEGFKKLASTVRVTTPDEFTKLLEKEDAEVAALFERGVLKPN